nr:nuclear transport factor 2 family protein [Kofleriaceae bacterium]
MTLMTGTIAVLCTTALAVGCKKNNADSTKPTSNAGVAKATPAKPTPLTGDQLVKRIHDCWADRDAANWDALAKCYAAGATADAPGSEAAGASGPAAIVERAKLVHAASSDRTVHPQLVLVDGNKLAAIVLATGKQTGPAPGATGGAAATDQPFGYFAGQLATVDDAGNITHESRFFDADTRVGQVDPAKRHHVRPVTDKLAAAEQVAVAQHDAKERANLATFHQLVDAFDKHDHKAVAALLADDATWSESPMRKDDTKPEAVTHLERLWKGFSNLQLQVGDAWAAGDYVVATETLAGTNDGNLAAMHADKTGKQVSVPVLAVHELANGKVTATWLFFQGHDLAKQLGVAKS